MADEKTCPHCGKPVPLTALSGICPECMLKAGLATQTEGAGRTGPHGTKVVPPLPKPEEIAPLFPQLEILECLGRGGMGVVYKARQPRLNRLVALKILAREKEQYAQFAERFTREAQALARLNHPNIVTVHDFGEVGGHCYLVMEFVDGLNLRQLLQSGKMKPEQALAIVPKICEALQYAHEQGIVHRDIKPENILLDKQGRVKIADFGIAKMMGDEAGQQTLTGAKDTVGTPHYMAPEQIEKPLTVDHRADIYSLGVVFYEMLTGELPLGKFQPPSKKVQIDVRLDEVVLHALEKEPERRYQQASQVKTAVETIAQTQKSEVKWRFSRTAIAGAVCVPISLVPIFWFVTYVRRMTQATTPSTYDTSWLNISLGIAGFLGLVLFAPLVTSILGWTAVSQVRRSAGRLAGLKLALFDGLFFPLLMLDTMVAGLWTVLQKLLAIFVWKVPGGNLFFDGLDFLIWLTLLALMLIWIDAQIIRRVWRVVNKPPAHSIPGSSGRESAPLESARSQSRLTPAATAFRRGTRVGLWIFILIVIAASVITFLLPRAYVGIARVKLTDFSPQGYNPYLVENELNVIESDGVLEKVATSLNLGERWGKQFNGGRPLSDDELMVLMRSSIDVRPRRNTDVIEIQFFSQSPKEAAEIANKIAETYCALPPGHNADIIERAVAPFHPIRPNVPLNILLGIVGGGVIGIFAGLMTGLFLFWRLRITRREGKLSANHPDTNLTPSRSARFGTAWKFAAFIFVLILSYELSRTVFSHLIAGHSHPVKSDYIGQADFPQGDSIKITSVERTKNEMTVKGHYDLVSHDKAELALYITVPNENAPEGKGEIRPISKGHGDFTLVYLPLVPGLPHVSMYGADGHPFASLYFGIKAEALAESKAGWITNATHVPKFSERFVAVIRHETNALASALQFRLVLPQDSTEPADDLPSVSGHNRLHLSRQVLLDDAAIAQAGVSFDPFGRRMIEIRFTETGAKKFEAFTSTNIGRQLAIVFRGQQVLSAPIIQSVIPNGECQVDGSMDADKMNEIVDCLNRTTTPTVDTWSFSPVHERTLPFEPQSNALFGWLDLDSGMVLTNSSLDLESHSGYDWIRTNGLDVVTAESAKRFPTLLGVDMRVVPAPINGWKIVIPADVIHNWAFLQNEPRQMQIFGASPGQTNTFFFQTREGGKGVLQILGFADSPPGVKIRYKLVRQTAPNTVIDSVTGLPTAPAGGTTIDPTTGLPMSSGGNETIEATTGLPAVPLAAESTTNVVTTAEKWLALIDGGNYSESRNEASAIFQRGVTEAAWENSMNTFRKPLGNLVSRYLKSGQAMTELPGAPDGQYVVMQFQSSFANKKSATETVTFMLEKDGQWKAAGYFIK